MRNIPDKMRNVGILLAMVFAFNSCLLDEFKVDGIRMKEDWNMNVVFPLFRGNLEFKDLVDDWDTLVFQDGEQASLLKFSNDSLLTIPSRIIFEPVTVIDSLSFLIDGNYSLSSISLEYTVSNACPFPLNFQMRFFDKINPVQLSPPVLPPPFLSANFNGIDFIPVETTHVVALTNEQVQSFATSNRVEFTTWFNPSDLINTTDTFLANYPVGISIVLYGVAQRKNGN